ncbi:DUF305 domain-containing protein [Streptosporangium sandarakinum]|uniref:Uncharacterized protein (DUF305 family) n=1 Tax=Streptosporangium sandarakinum TaxID=1260955 RepID=A0A852UXP5_9ACTN|nr:DUF305 domain-containing protein [Streptosporangium sandarakinum]NYF39834.1 uncharacterized protein (DUF305 family) [Streptosporangium sandarakinum]
MRGALVAVAAVLCLSACSAGADRPPAQALQTAPIIAPGRPGEPARTLSPGEAATAVPSPTANAADVKYVQDMIVHHRQALDMASLAPTRARNTKVKGLAARIKDAQGPEIQYMITWLRQQGQRVPDQHGDHAAMPAMPGMATPEQMAALKAASGEDFDRLFLELMTAHHRGALTMSGQVLVDGSHIKIEELANEISVGQTAEINRMREILAGL